MKRHQVTFHLLLQSLEPVESHAVTFSANEYPVNGRLGNNSNKCACGDDDDNKLNFNIPQNRPAELLHTLKQSLYLERVKESECINSAVLWLVCGLFLLNYS